MDQCKDLSEIGTGVKGYEIKKIIFLNNHRLKAGGLK